MFGTLIVAQWLMFQNRIGARSELIKLVMTGFIGELCGHQLTTQIQEIDSHLRNTTLSQRRIDLAITVNVRNDPTPNRSVLDLAKVVIDAVFPSRQSDPLHAISVGFHRAHRHSTHGTQGVLTIHKSLRLDLDHPIRPRKQLSELIASLSIGGRALQQIALGIEEPEFDAFDP